MFSFQGASLNLTRDSMKLQLSLELQSISFKKWWAKMDSLSCGKATAVTTCRRHVVKSRLSSHFVLPFNSSLVQGFFFSLTYLEVVGQNGLEPSTSRLSVVCSSQLSYWPIFRTSFGGEYRDRTGDLLLARQALSQLS